MQRVAAHEVESNNDLKVQADEFAKQFGSDLAKLADVNGNGEIDRIEYEAFVKMFDQDGDGKLLDDEVRSAQNSSVNDSSTSLKDQFKSIFSKLLNYRKQYVPMLSGHFNDINQVDPNTQESDTKFLDKLLDSDGNYSWLEQAAFIRYADKNGDGIISDAEKKAAMNALQGDNEKAKLKSEYAEIKANEAELKALDKNGDGKVSKEEFAAKYGKGLAEMADAVLKTDGNIDINEFLALIKYADSDGDGKLNDSEIKAADGKLNNPNIDSMRAERRKLLHTYWVDTVIGKESYQHMVNNPR
jgi:Ca2+-binding EF-hand superfamily protein